MLNLSLFVVYGMYGLSCGEIELEYVKVVNIIKGLSVVV